MKKTFLTALLLAAVCIGASPSTLDTSSIDAGLGRSGQLLGGGVYRVGFPRSDLDDRIGSEGTLGRTGRVSGRVLSVGAPRVEAITMNGMSVPTAAGVATAMNFQDAGRSNVATTGDFVLVASEVESVQQTLLAHGFEVTALHHHMLDDNPHLYYMHFWAVGPPPAIATALKDALSDVNVKP